MKEGSHSDKEPGVYLGSGAMITQLLKEKYHPQCVAPGFRGQVEVMNDIMALGFGKRDRHNKKNWFLLGRLLHVDLVPGGQLQPKPAAPWIREKTVGINGNFWYLRHGTETQLS